MGGGIGAGGGGFLMFYAEDKAKLRHIMRSGQADDLTIIGGVFAYGINRTVTIAGAKSAHGIILFEAEAERIDDGMTALAILRLGELRYFLAHGQIRSEIRVLESHRHRRRLERPSDNVSGQEHSAMNR